MLYLGTDLVHIPRIRSAIDRFGVRFLRRVYTAQEQQTCWRSLPKSSPFTALDPEILLKEHLTADVVNRLAARWAAKEAIVKALGTGWDGVGYTDVEITRQPTGEPQVALHGRAIAALDRRLIPHSQPVWQVSFSHDADYALASAVLLCQPIAPPAPGIG